MSEQKQLKITIRGMEPDDWEAAADIRDSGNIFKYTLQVPYQSRDGLREYMENPLARQMMIVAEVDDTVVGQLGLERNTGRRAHAARLGMMVHTDYQGKGVGSALMVAALDLADNWLNVSRIELEVFTENAAAVALYEKFGFEIEGTLRDYAFREGEYIDAHLMARIKEDND